MKLSNQFKGLTAAIGGLVILGGVLFNQVALTKQVQWTQNQVEKLSARPTVTVVPTAVPTASPTAALKFVPATVKPVVSPVK